MNTVKDCDFIILAGCLVRIPDYMIDAYPKRIINIHPALLPKYGGKGPPGSNTINNKLIDEGANIADTIEQIYDDMSWRKKEKFC